MGGIHKLTKNGQTIYPATTTDAVVDKNTKKNIIHSINNAYLSDIFLPDSNLEGLGCGSIIDFGIVSLPENYSTELYLRHFNNKKGLLQITDSNENVIAQYLKNTPKSGIEVIEISQWHSSGVTLGAIVNWDAIGSITSFSGGKLHINKNRKFIGDLHEAVYNLNKKLEGLDFSQYYYILYNIRKWSGEGTAGLDSAKKNLYDNKIINIWGKCDTKISIIHLRNAKDSLIQIAETSNLKNLVAQYFVSSVTSGVQTHKLTNLSSAPEGTEIYVTVDWNQVTNETLGSTKETSIDVLFLPENEITGSIDDKLSQVGINTKDISEIKESIFEQTSWEDGSDFSLINNSILDVWNDSVIDDGSTIYLAYARSRNALIQFWSKKDESSPVAQFFPSDGTEIVRKGIETVDVKFLSGNGHDGETFKVLVNWDLVPESANRLGIEFPLKRLRKYMNYFSYKRLGELEKKMEYVSLPDWFKDEENNQLSINVFGDIISKQFKDKWFSYNKDLEILLLGDSIVGLQSTSGEIPDKESIALPPGCQYYHWTWGLYNQIVKNKPIYNRADSDIFTKTGTFEKITSSGETKLDQPSHFGEWSVVANTYQCNDAGASVQFEWNLGEYEKLNIIHSLNPDGANCVIQIGDGSFNYNGKVLLSIDKSEWIEANNYFVNQNSNPNSLSESECEQQGFALHQRHRRIWMKRVEGTSDVLTISFKKTDVDEDKYIYFWGTERWNGYTTIITNLGRGGRSTDLLNKNISDVIERNPDLVIHSLSLANETKTPITTLKSQYKRFFFGGEEDDQEWIKQRSMLTKSENYTKFSYLVIMPHGRGSDFIGNTVAPATIDNIPQYFRYKIMAKYIKDNAELYENVSVIELFDQILNEGKRMGMNFEQTLIGTSNHPGSFTSDGIHLNRLGSAIYVKYLSPIFDLL